MIIKILLRGGIYVLFIVAVVVRWIYKRVNTAAPFDDVETPLSAADSAHVVVDDIAHPDWGVRMAAIQQMADQPDSAQIAALIAALDDDVYDVREAAANALIAHGDSVLESVIAVLENGSLEAREMAVMVLASFPTTAAVTALETALQTDVSAWVRVPAAEALGNTGSQASVPVLINALSDDHRDVYRAVVAALRQIGTSEALQAIDDHPYDGDKKRTGRSYPEDDRLQFS